MICVVNTTVLLDETDNLDYVYDLTEVPEERRASFRIKSLAIAMEKLVLSIGKVSIVINAMILSNTRT